MEFCLTRDAAGGEMRNGAVPQARQVYGCLHGPFRPVVREAGHADGSRGVKSRGELRQQIGGRNYFQPYPCNSFLAHYSPFFGITATLPAGADILQLVRRADIFLLWY
jgi:hypothetical protein